MNLTERLAEAARRWAYAKGELAEAEQDLNLTERLAEAARRWAYAKGELAEAEQDLFELTAAAEGNAPAPVEEEDRDAVRRRAIVQARKRRGWSQHELGMKIGFGFSSQARLSQLENNWRPLTAPIFNDIADAFGLSPAELEQLGREKI